MKDDKCYPCTWKKTTKGFEVRSVDFPDICGQGKTLYDAEEQFAFKLSDRVRQWPATFGYTVPAPVDEEFAKFQSDWILVTGSNAVLNQREPLSKWFKGGACSKCGTPKGPRTDEELSFEHTSDAVEDIVAVTSGAMCIKLYSKRFVNTIFDSKVNNVELRVTRQTKRQKKEYFEIIPRKVIVPVVPGFCIGTWWQCSDCGTAIVGGRFRVGELQYFFDEDDVSSSANDIIVVGQRDSGELLISLRKWRGTRNGQGLTGVSTYRVGVLPKSMHLGYAVDYQKAKEAPSAA